MTIRARLSVEGLEAADEAEKRARMDEMLADTEIVVGEAKVGARGEREMSAVERIVEKMGEKTMPWLNETAMALGVAGAVSLYEWSKGRAIGIIGRFIAPGAAAAYIVGVKEAIRLREERHQHAREMAESKFEGVELQGRRAKLERARYETASADALTSWMQEFYNDDGELEITSPDDFRELMQRIGHVQARIDVADSQDINLIGFSSTGAAARENWDMMKAKARLKSDLRHYLAGLDEADLTAHGYTAEQIAHIRSGADRFDSLFEATVSSHEGLIVKSLRESDDEFAKIRAIEVAKKAGAAGITGIFVGTTLAEAAAIMSDSQEAFLEPDVAGPNQETTVDRAWELGPGDNIADEFKEQTNNMVDDLKEQANSAWDFVAHQDQTVEVRPADMSASKVELSATADVQLPEGFKVDVNKSAQTFSVNGPNNFHLENLRLTSSGTLTTEAEHALKNAGFKVRITEGGAVVEQVEHKVKVNANEFVNQNSKYTTSIKHEGWLDNNTVGIFDKNEQGLNNGWREKDGDIRLEIGRMTEGGSYHNGREVNWNQEAANGNMQVTVYASKGAYNEGFTFKVDENGRAIVPKDHPAQQLFSKNQGRLDFHGYLTEVQYIDNVDSKGTQNVWTLATDVGDKHKTFTNIVKEPVPHPITSYSLEFNTPIATTTEATSDDDETVPPFFVPVVSRSGMQPAATTTTRPGVPRPGTPLSGAAPRPPRREGVTTPPRTPDEEVFPPINRQRGGVYYGSTFRPGFEAGAAPRNESDTTPPETEDVTEGTAAQPSTTTPPTPPPRFSTPNLEDLANASHAEAMTSGPLPIESAETIRLRTAEQMAADVPPEARYNNPGGRMAAKEAERKAEQQRRREKDEANYQEIRDTRRRTVDSLLHTPEAAPTYQFYFPIIGKGELRPYSAESAALLARAIEQATKENDDLNPAHFQLSPGLSDEKREAALAEQRRHLTRIARRVDALIHPDAYEEFLTPEELKIFDEARQFWSLARKDLRPRRRTAAAT